MSEFGNLPFPRGKTFFDGGTVDTGNTSAVALEGKEYEVWDDTYKDYVRLLCVRNVCPATGGHDAAGGLLPKRLASFKSGKYGRQVDSAADIHTKKGFPVDEKLAAAGCPANDLCYLVIRGPALIRSSLAGDASNNFSEGDWLVNATAASSGATTAGRARKIDTTGATDVLAQQIMNRIGRALSAKTTNNTDADILTFVAPLW